MPHKLLIAIAVFSGFCSAAVADPVTPPTSQTFSAWVAEPGETATVPEQKFAEPYSAATPYLEPAEAVPHYSPSACSRGEPKEDVVYLTQ